MSRQLVQAYFNEIDVLKKVSGSTTEGVVSEAFKDLLKAWARQKNLVFVAQYEFLSPQKNRIRPDGTILHDLRVPLGYWEAKDESDDLDVEIEKKLKKGYPQSNIIFEDGRQAVLIQNRAEIMRCGSTDEKELLRLLTLFFGYERAEIADWRKAVQQFKADLPAVLGALREKIDLAYSGNKSFRAAADKFLQHAKDTINPTLGEADVREMLIQHILTEEIFANVFNDSDFHRENNIAKELYGLEGAFFTGAVKRDTLAALQPYYAAIRSNAALINSHAEKQSFLKVIYENFYKVYDTKKADRLGVVYTPNEIVKFMIDGADWLTQKHFGKALIDEGVEILDPATGTGTFICELLEHFRGQPEKLAKKYKNELHANEVAILPYYVANLNIEATYAAITGQYAEFPNLCFVDTLDNIGGLKSGSKETHYGDLLGALSDENVERVKRQNSRKISVIIGNPPYNANQQNENDNNKNRTYPHIDAAIKASFVRLSDAHKTKLYDMYARFFRWASDRIQDEGVVAFVTNRSFIESRTFDGFRRAVGSEFSEIYVVDLGGDVRSNPLLSGTKHNVFGIQTGIAISFLVRRRSSDATRIYLTRTSELDTAEEKLAYLASARLATISFQRVEPDKQANWLPSGTNEFHKLLPLVLPKLSGRQASSDADAIFVLSSYGVLSLRDSWVFDQNKEALEAKLGFYVGEFNEAQSVLKRPLVDGWDSEIGSTIKWSQDARTRLARGEKLELRPNRIVSANYRPFSKLWYYYEPSMNWSLSMTPSFFPVGGSNRAISFSDTGRRSEFLSLAVDALTDIHFGASIDAYQQVGRYRYTKGGERIDNITDWGLKQFRNAYGLNGVLDPSRLAAQDEGGIEDETPTPALRADPPHKGEGAQSSTAKESSVPSVSLPLVGRDAEQDLATLKSVAKPGGGKRQLTKDDIFHYVYAVLHDPLYREKYALNLKREFPRIPFYLDFWKWAGWGEKLMALHIGYESVEPWPLTRIDVPDERAKAAGLAPKAMLKADKDNGNIRLDSETQFAGVPPEVWDYKLGNRSGVEWILDQYKEKTPKDPTIREKFNTYRFADYKEKVIDLIGRVTRVSVETVAITEAMKAARR